LKPPLLSLKIIIIRQKIKGKKLTRESVQRAWEKASKIGKTYAGFWDNKARTSFQTNMLGEEVSV
jgi:hypothetical protein